MLAALIFIMLNSSQTFAGPPPADEAFTIDSAVHTALTSNPTVQQAREKVNQGEADLSTAYSQLFPNISGNITGQYRQDAENNPNALFNGQPYNQYNVGFTGNQPIYAGGLLTGGIGAAKSTRSIDQLTADMTARNLTLTVIQDFYSVILAERNLDILQETEKVDEELLNTTEKFERMGRAQLLDVLQVKTTLALLIPQIEQAANQIKIAATQLATTLGYRDAREIQVQGKLFLPDRKKFESVMKQSELHLWENEIASEQIKQVDYQKDITLAKELPNLSGSATWARNAYVKTDLLNDDATTWAVTLNLTIPIFSGLSSVYERRSFASQESQAEINETNTKDQTTLNQVQGLKNLDLAEKTVHSTEKALDLAQKSLTEAKRQFKLGLSNLLQYLQSEQSLLAAETASEQAKYNYIVNLAQYLSAMGYSPIQFVNNLETKL